jgi:HD-GYP domain-containing protein (c-di-GMP phosphodiesterase class II)
MLQANTTISIDDSIKENKAITSDFDNLEDLLSPHQQKPLKSTENAQKSKGDEVEKEVQKLKDFANGIYKQLNEKSQKSLHKFVKFYTDKIVNNGFRINPKNNWEKWIANDKNLK